MSPATGAALRRQRNREELHAAILDAAREVVTTQGVDKLTIRGIAQTLGYSAGAIYEYFDSKETILKSLYFEGAQGLAGALRRTLDNLSAGTSSVQALIALGHGYRDFALEHAELYRLIFGAAHVATEGPVDRSEDMGGFGVLAQVARQGLDEEVFLPLPPPAIAATAWSGVHGFVSLELSGHIPGSSDPAASPLCGAETREVRNRLFEAVVLTIARGLATDKGRALIDRA